MHNGCRACQCIGYDEFAIGVEPGQAGCRLKPIILVHLSDVCWRAAGKIEGRLFVGNLLCLINVFGQSLELVKLCHYFATLGFAKAILKAQFCSLCTRRKESSERKRSCRVSRYVNSLAVMSSCCIYSPPPCSATLNIMRICLII
jgi:hypothetical protein